MRLSVACTVLQMELKICCRVGRLHCCVRASLVTLTWELIHLIFSYWLAAIGSVHVLPVRGFQSLCESHFAGMASQRILHRSSLNQLSLESTASIAEKGI